MRLNIYIVTLFNDIEFKARNLQKLCDELNDYFEKNNILDMNNKVYHYNFYKLKSKMYNKLNAKYLFKKVQIVQLEDLLKEDIEKTYPDYNEKSYKMKRKYLNLLLESKNIII